MKGLILSGGAGTRLRPITHTSAKQLVPVANKPILFYGIEDLVEAGIRDIGIVVGHTGDEIRAAVGDGSRWDAKITYIDQPDPLGLAHCVQIAGDFLGGDDFVMYLGDNLLRQGVREFAERFEADRGNAAPGVDGGAADPPAAQILLARVPDPQRFGVAEVDEQGHVVRLLEKPEHPPSDLALVGVYLFDATIHRAVAAIEPSARGELEITDAIQWLIDNGYRVRHQVLDGWWKDTGKVEPLLQGNQLVLETIERDLRGSVDDESMVEGRVVVEEGAEIVGSTIRGPAIVGAGTRVTNSYIGPNTSVSSGCEIVDSEIEHSIVLEGSRVVGIPRLVDTLIGRQAEVIRGNRRPRAVRLMIGDHSKVELEP